MQLRSGYAGSRVLLAEDEPIAREIMCCLLEDVGFLVDLAADGRQAVELARRNPYELILMDIQMPELDGIEATRAIRSMGVNDHITKPVHPGKLYETLLAWLSCPPRLTPTQLLAVIGASCPF